MKEIVKYVRDKKRRPKGVVMALFLNGTDVKFGWSLCNTKMGDRFDKKLGRDIARGRCLRGDGSPPAQSVDKDYRQLVTIILYRVGKKLAEENQRKDENKWEITKTGESEVRMNV